MQNINQQMKCYGEKNYVERRNVEERRFRILESIASVFSYFNYKIVLQLLILTNAELLLILSKNSRHIKEGVTFMIKVGQSKSGESAKFTSRSSLQAFFLEMEAMQAVFLLPVFLKFCHQLSIFFNLHTFPTFALTDQSRPFIFLFKQMRADISRL